jgi:hypothetical protein
VFAPALPNRADDFAIKWSLNLHRIAFFDPLSIDEKGLGSSEGFGHLRHGNVSVPGAVPTIPIIDLRLGCGLDWRE